MIDIARVDHNRLAFRLECVFIPQFRSPYNAFSSLIAGAVNSRNWARIRLFSNSGVILIIILVLH